MTQHPEEGTLHAYIDGELSQAEAAALELHVGECALCAAALAEARGLAAAASRVITTLDAAPSSAALPATPVVVKPSVRPRRTARPPIFRLPYARAAALLLLAGGAAVVVDRTGTFARGKSPQAESSMADLATTSEVAPAATAQAATPTAAVTAPAVTTETDLSGARGAVTGNAARNSVAPPRVVAGRAADGARRARPVERDASPTEAAPIALFEQRGVAGGTAAKPRAAAPEVALAGKDAAPTAARATALPAATPVPPPPAREAMRLEEVVVTGVLNFGPTVSRYRTKDGAILTLTEEPLRTSFAEESLATRQHVPASPQRKVAASMAATPINSYRWSSAERGKTYTLSGPLTVPELEALSRRLSELERVP